jgi:hypothetical protein
VYTRTTVLKSLVLGGMDDEDINKISLLLMFHCSSSHNPHTEISGILRAKIL